MRGTFARTAVAALVALVLALTGQTVALARVQIATGPTIVICSGDGPIEITLDADGNPQPAKAGVHVCPDCILHIIAAPDMAQPALERPAARSHPVVPVPVQLSTTLAAPPSCARGPPAAV